MDYEFVAFKSNNFKFLDVAAVYVDPNYVDRKIPILLMFLQLHKKKKKHNNVYFIDLL